MNNNSKTILIVAAVVIVSVVGYSILTKPDTRSTGERFGDAVEKLDSGIDDAAREMESRTPAERIKDEVQDAAE